MLEEVFTKRKFYAVTCAHPLVIVYAHAPDAVDVQFNPLQNLQILTGTSAAFYKMSILCNEETRALKHDFALARFPSTLVFTHGEIREIVIGDDVERLLASVAKWYKTVYATPALNVN